MIIDTHAHLNDSRYEDIDKLIKDAKDYMVSSIITISCNKEEVDFVVDITSKYENIYGAVGEHPITAYNTTQQSYDKIESVMNNKKIVAIGECGLDFHWKESTKEQQEEVFRKQIDLAIKYDKPLIIHTRDSIQETFDILKEYKGKIRGVIHCFSSSIEMANEFIKLNFMVSIGGVVTFKNAKYVKEVAKTVDINYLLLETDSPYLTPEPNRGKLNEPKYTRLVAEEIAKLRNISFEELALITTKNAKKLFNI